MNMRNGAGEEAGLRLALERLRAGGLALEREGGRLRLAALAGCWRALAADLRDRLEYGELDQRGRARLELLEELLRALERGGLEDRRRARDRLEGALLAGLAGLLAGLRALRRGALAALELEGLRAALADLEGALLEDLERAGGERLELAGALRARLEREGTGALLLCGGRGERLAGALQEARGWRAALAAGLEELLREREEDQRREDQRRAGARAGGAPALPAALAGGLEGLLRPRRICGREELAPEEREELARLKGEGEGLAICWREGGAAPSMAMAGGIPEELLRAGGAALAGVAGDLLVRDLCRRAAACKAAGESPGLICYPGGLRGLALALAGQSLEEGAGRRIGGREIDALRAALEVGQRITVRVTMPGGGARWIGGLWSWDLLEGGHTGNLLRIAPAPALQPGGGGIGGALLPALQPPPLPVATGYRAAALRLQWRWLAALRQGALEELRGGARELEGLAPLQEGERLRLARELEIPPASALKLDRAWIGGAEGWLEKLRGGRWRLRDRAGERLLREGIALAARGAGGARRR